MDRRIERALKSCAAATLKLKDVVRSVQRACKHADLAECSYQPGVSPPWRICRCCGMTEEGWGCGFLVLRGEAVPINRDEVYRLRRGLHIREDHKGPLLRREITVEDLFDNTFEEA